MNNRSVKHFLLFGALLSAFASPVLAQSKEARGHSEQAPQKDRDHQRAEAAPERGGRARRDAKSDTRPGQAEGSSENVNKRRR
jgi:hypothetical protein